MIFQSSAQTRATRGIAHWAVAVGTRLVPAEQPACGERLPTWRSDSRRKGSRPCHSPSAPSAASRAARVPPQRCQRLSGRLPSGLPRVRARPRADLRRHVRPHRRPPGAHAGSEARAERRVSPLTGDTDRFPASSSLVEARRRLKHPPKPGSGRRYVPRSRAQVDVRMYAGRVRPRHHGSIRMEQGLRPSLLLGNEGITGGTAEPAFPCRQATSDPRMEGMRDWRDIPPKKAALARRVTETTCAGLGARRRHDRVDSVDEVAGRGGALRTALREPGVSSLDDRAPSAGARACRSPRDPRSPSRRHPHGTPSSRTGATDAGRLGRNRPEYAVESGGARRNHLPHRR